LGAKKKMKLVSKLMKWAAFGAGLVLLGAVLGWLAIRSPAGKTASPDDGPQPLEFQPADSSPALVQHHPKPPQVGLANEVPTMPNITSDVITNWEEKLEEILSSAATEAEKAKQIMAIFGRLPQDGQVEAAQHLSNLVANQDYAPLGRMLTNSALPDDVLDVLMSDVLNRPNSMKLPLLLDVARNDQHPKTGEARDLLELYLEQDYGDDWAQWQVRLEQWLRQNPD
jgi:hypothetical protein